MPPLPYANRVLLVRVSGEFATAVPWAFLDHWIYNGQAPSNADLTQWSTAIHLAYQNYLAAQFGNDTTMNLVEAVDLSGPNNAVGSASGTVSGSGGSALVPDSVCVLESKHGTYKYRGGHSRTYYPALGPSGSQLSGNSWTATAIQAFAVALQGYLNSIIGDAAGRVFGGIQRAIVHYKGSHPGVTYPLIEPATSSTVVDAFGSQRRRLGKH